MKFTKKRLFGTIATFVACFGIIWTFAEPLGLSGGIQLWFTILILSILFSTIYLLIIEIFDEKKAYNQFKIEKQQEIRELTLELNKTSKKLELASLSTCCIFEQKTNKCPLGVSNIYPKMETTIRSTLESSKKSYKWYGLSAFNVFHNNKDIFLTKQGVEFEFTILNPSNKMVADRTDNFHLDTKGRMTSYKLIKQSKKLIESFQKDVNPNISLSYCNMIPTFRIIIVDNQMMYVSFYEKGKDALSTFQIEIENNGKDTNIFNWFYEYYEKCQISNQILQK